MFKELIRPPHLKHGDTIAIVSCSWGGPHALPKRFEEGKRRLKDIFGLRVIEMQHTRSSAEYLAAHPEARAADLMNAFKDPNIKGIIASIGGNDAIKMLPYIDYNLIKENPKVVIGYSDFSVVHFMCLKAGLSSFYGPVVMCEFAENISMSSYLVNSIKRTLFMTEPVGEIQPSSIWTNEFLDWNLPVNQHKSRIYKRDKIHQWNFIQGSGEVSGHLVGGCLDVIDPFIRETDLWLDHNSWKNSILFLEISEDGWSPQVVKEALNRIGDKGVLAQIKGLLFGRPAGSKEWNKDFLAYDQVILETCLEYGRDDIPIITQMDFGHTTPAFIIPYGANITIDCDAKKIYLKDSACTPRIESAYQNSGSNEIKRVPHEIKFLLKLDSTLRKKYIFQQASVFWKQRGFKEHLVDICDRNFLSNDERKKYILALMSSLAISLDKDNANNLDWLIMILNTISFTQDDINRIGDIASFSESINNVNYPKKLKEFIKEAGDISNYSIRK